MNIYTVHHRQEATGSLTGLADDAVLVKQGFSWPAFLVPLFWLVWKRMWIVLALYLAVEMGLAAVTYTELASQGAVAAASLAVNLILGFQGNDLYRWTLERRRYREQAVVAGRDLAAAEHRYFSVAAGAIRRDRAVVGAVGGGRE